jgi:polysaccharide pyruvyl transferase WcaK-like protein
LLFLRHDNYDIFNLLEKKDVTFKPMNSNNSIQISMSDCDFATSDIFRDKDVLGKLCKKYHCKITLCNTVKDLYQTISKYQYIITDRYHPAVIGFLLKKEVLCLASKNDTKMSGLLRMIGNSDIEDLIALAKRSLSW